MTDTIRTFIAVELPDELHKELATLQEKLKTAQSDTGWVKPENIHITLKFLGYVTPDKIEAIKKSLDAIAKNEQPFALSVKDIGAFPKLSYPRVIWVGIEESKNLSALAAKIEDAMEKLGFKKEERLFAPHLTLGRVKSAQNKDKLVSLLEKTKFASDIAVKASEIILFQSTLTKGGSIYTPLHKAGFTA
ncbi:MAG: RNA 2',3'-cyclic phosphodiesterase [Candidatus Omnitrophota bacterium]